MLYVAKPSAPNGLQVIETKKDYISLSWRIPNTDGGSPITGYTIETKQTGSTRWTSENKGAVTDTAYKLTGLREGRFYDIRVCAVNEAGAGPYAEIRGDDATSRTTPGTFCCSFMILTGNVCF